MITYLEQLNIAAGRAGMTLEQAAALANVHPDTVKRWLDGRIRPRQGTVESILRALEEQEQ